MLFGQTKYYGIALPLLILIFYCACGKIAEPNIEYDVDGIHDVSIVENGNVRVMLNVNPKSKKSELVTLSLSGLPSGVSYSFNNTVGEPPFSTELYIKDDSSKGGDYQVQLLSNSASGKNHSYDFKLTTADKSCAKKISGMYQATAICRDNTGDILNRLEVTPDSSNINMLHFVWRGKIMNLIINCNKNQVTLPAQTIDNYKISGSGYIDANYSIINFDYIERHNNGDTVSCNMHMVKL